MPKWEVTYKQIERYVVTVEAESMDAALAIVDDMIDDDSIKEHHYDSDGEFDAYKV